MVTFTTVGTDACCRGRAVAHLARTTGIQPHWAGGHLANTIVANSTSGGNCSRAVTDLGGNVDDGTTCGFSAANHSLSRTNPRLLPLADNGGPTQTMGLRYPTSPAIGAGRPAICLAQLIIDLDQPGLSRHAQARGACDSGAYDTGGAVTNPGSYTGTTVKPAGRLPDSGAAPW